MVAGIVAFSLLIVAWQFGSVANGIRALQGYSVLPEQSVVSAGNVVAGQPVTVAFRLRNHTSGGVASWELGLTAVALPTTTFP